MSELMKRATAQKKAGELAAAIRTLEQALMAAQVEDYPRSGIRLKLAPYLQAGGESEKGWACLEAALSDFSLEVTDPELLPMGQSEIFDKMRLFLQREGRPLEGVRYAALSHVCWGIGLNRQRRREEFEEQSDPGLVGGALYRLLEKAGRLDLLDELVTISVRAMAKPSAFDVGLFARELESVLKR